MLRLRGYLRSFSEIERWGVLVAVLLLWPRVTFAQQLYVFGPAGTEEGRRVMAVLEDAEGRCVPSDASIEWSSSTAEVHVEEQAGPCVRWLRLRTSEAHERMVLEAAYGDFHAAMTVPLDERDQLEIRARRRGRRVEVTVEGADEQEDLSGYVQTAGGEVALESQGEGGLGALVSDDGLLGVVVRSGAMVGVTAVAPGAAPGQPQVLVLAADMAIEAGGPPREAAFVVAVDARGRLSSRLPLNIESARGELRSLRWLAEGTAAVGLSAPVSVGSVDLSVGIGEETLAEAVLEVTAHWPVEARFESPDSIDEGEPFDVRVRAYGADGSPVDTNRMRLRCGSGAYAAAPFTCPASVGPEAQTLVVGALVDGRVVPLATHNVVVRPPPPPPEPVLGPPPRLMAEVAIRGSYDMWSRAGFGVALRLWYQTTSWLRVGVGTEYTGIRLRAPDQNETLGALSGLRHDLGVYVLADAGFGSRVGAAIRLALGGGYGRASASVADQDASGRSAFVLARVSAGPRLRLERFEFGVDVGASFGLDLGHRAWEQPWLTGFVEVNGAIRF